jgi:ornithine cyclodeaminase/alanine dehydrogenase-like protein (mu-crystallin family)
MKILSPEDTRAALPWDKLIDALEEGFRSEVTSPLRHHHHMKNDGAEDDVILLMPAWRDGGWGGIKLVNVHPGNSKKGMPALSSTYLLFNRETGAHELILDGGELTARRTAAASALAAKKLARQDSRRQLVVGAGRVGSNVPYAYLAALPIEEFEIWDRNEANAERLVADLTANGHEAARAPDLQAAVIQADVITCATLAREPLVLGDWLRPGQHVDLIGSFTPDMREVDDTAMQRARVFIDTDHAKLESGDIKVPLETGAIAERDIVATLTQLCREEVAGRASRDEITLFKGVGLAAEDLSAAVLAMRISAAS